MVGGYFRVDGADLETGEESYLVLQATSVAEAESVARSQGLLIAAVRPASSADWGAKAGAKSAPRPPRPIEAVITFEPRTPSKHPVAVPAPVAVAPPSPARPAEQEYEPFELMDAEPVPAANSSERAGVAPVSTSSKPASGSGTPRPLPSKHAPSSPIRAAAVAQVTGSSISGAAKPAAPQPPRIPPAPATPSVNRPTRPDWLTASRVSTSGTAQSPKPAAAVITPPASTPPPQSVAAAPLAQESNERATSDAASPPAETLTELVSSSSSTPLDTTPPAATDDMMLPPSVSPREETTPNRESHTPAALDSVPEPQPDSSAVAAGPTISLTAEIVEASSSEPAAIPSNIESKAPQHAAEEPALETAVEASAPIESISNDATPVVTTASDGGEQHPPGVHAEPIALETPEIPSLAANDAAISDFVSPPQTVETTTIEQSITSHEAHELAATSETVDTASTPSETPAPEAGELLMAQELPAPALEALLDTEPSSEITADLPTLPDVADECIAPEPPEIMNWQETPDARAIDVAIPTDVDASDSNTTGDLPSEAAPIDPAPNLPEYEPVLSLSDADSPGVDTVISLTAPTPVVEDFPAMHQPVQVLQSIGEVEAAPMMVQPTQKRLSVFADSLLSSEVTSWVSSQPTGEKTLVADAGSASLPDDAIPSASSDKSADEMPAAKVDEPPVAVANDAIESPDTAAESIESKAAAIEEIAELVLAGAGSDELEFAAESASGAHTRSSGYEMASSALAVKEEASEPRTVPVKAKAVIAPKVGLAANLRRVATPPAVPGAPSSRTSTASGPNADAAKPIAKTITITPESGGDSSPPAPGSKPPQAPIRTYAATVQTRRLGRPGPITPVRRTLPPSTPPVPPATVPAPEDHAAPTEAKASLPSPANLPVQRAPATPEPVRAVAKNAEVSGLDQLFSRLASDQVTKPVEPTPALAHDVIVVEPAAPKPQPAQISQAPSIAEPQTPAPVALEELFAVAPDRLDHAVQSPVVPLSSTTPFKPAAQKSATVAKGSSASVSRLALFVLAPLATLMTLGGIAVIAMSLLTPMPTAAVQLERLDFHFQMLAQIFLGGTLLLGGLLIFVIAGLVHVARAIKSSATSSPAQHPPIR